MSIFNAEEYFKLILIARFEFQKSTGGFKDATKITMHANDFFKLHRYTMGLLKASPLRKNMDDIDGYTVFGLEIFRTKDCEEGKFYVH